MCVSKGEQLRFYLRDITKSNQMISKSIQGTKLLSLPSPVSMQVTALSRTALNSVDNEKEYLLSQII
jgi:hypothetical protein